MRSLSFGIFLCLLKYGSASQDFNITPIKTSSGLYYEKIGDVLLSNNNWEFVTSVDYAGYLLFYQYLQNQAEKLHDFCQEYQPANCEERYEVIRASMDSIAQTDEILVNFLGIESKRRVKRFWAQALTAAAPFILEPLGKGLSKFIFGDDVDQQRLGEYDQLISQLRKNQENIINQLGAQRTMFELDSERKGNQIKSLKGTQEHIMQELRILQGTVSNNFEEHERKIKDLNDMLRDTKLKLKKQEERQQQLTSEVKNIKGSIENINDDLEDIKRDITINKNQINATKIETRLNSISINFNFLLNGFGTEQRTLLDVIKNANRGFLDPYIITPLNLIEMLQGIQPMLPEDSRLPFHPNFENAKALYRIIKPTILLYNNQILFILEIPLVHTKTFEILKMTSLPMAVGIDKFVYVSPKKQYLLINDKQPHSLGYVLTSVMDFRDFCKDLGGSRYICDQIQHINGPTISECEAQLFLNKKQFSETCNTRVMKLTKPVFIKLQQYGAWIYVVPEAENLKISCRGRSGENINLRGTGLLQLSGNCTAQTSEFGLSYIPGSRTAAVSGAYSPVITLTEHIDMLKVDAFDETAPESYKQVILPFDLSELDAVSVRIKDIGVLHATINYGMIIFVVAGITAVMLLIIVFRKKIFHSCSGKIFSNKGRQDAQSTCRFTNELNNEIVLK